MTSKALLMILLFLSAVLVLYSPISSLIDVQKSIDNFGGVSAAALRGRDNLILQIIGFVFLYVVLAFGLDFLKVGEARNTFIQQELKPVKTKQTVGIEIPKEMPQTARILTKKEQNVIALLATLTFILVFVWQIFSNMPSNATSMGSDLVAFFMNQALTGLVACLVVGIAAYIIAKYR